MLYWLSWRIPRHCCVWLKLHSHWPGVERRRHSRRWPQLTHEAGKKGLASAALAPSAAFPGTRNGYNSPSFQDAPPAVGVSGRQAGLTVRMFSAFCHRTLLQLSRRQKRRSGVATVSEEDADYRPRGFPTGAGGDEVDYSFTSYCIFTLFWWLVSFPSPCKTYKFLKS